ncbi:MAG: zinc ribbon domain-containing protein [Planctomycetota bacterium]|jgi:hypothetical protein
MKCPNCNGENPSGTDFCHHCGWDLPDNPPVTKSTSNLQKCPSCGAGNPPDSILCSLCGEQFCDKENTGALALPADSAADEKTSNTADSENYGGTDKEINEHEDLLRRNNEGLTSAAEKAYLGDLELKIKDNPQGAAVHFFEACLMAPKNARIRNRYITLFPKEDLQNWGLGKAPIPVWSDIKNILKYPFADGAWLTLILASIFVSIVRIIAPFTGLFFFGILVILGAFIGSHICLHTRWAANGKFGEPPPIELDFGNLWYMFMSSLAAYLPAVAVTILAALLSAPNLVFVGFAFFFIGLFINPMCFLVARLYNACGQAFNYPFIIRSIMTVFGEYIFATSLIFFVWLINSIGYPMLVSAVPALEYAFFISDFISMYYFTVFARILGQLYYNNQKKLAWF